jgi:hypothetical protein
MSYDYEDREEATRRVDRYYEIQGVEPPEYDSEEWRETFNSMLDRVEEECSL